MDNSTPPKRPPCQCAARKQALQRAKEATERGDLEAARLENEFVKQSVLDDAKAHKDWLVAWTQWRTNSFASRLGLRKNG